jgi:hypothetical protein
LWDGLKLMVLLPLPPKFWEGHHGGLPCFDFDAVKTFVRPQEIIGTWLLVGLLFAPVPYCSPPQKGLPHRAGSCPAFRSQLHGAPSDDLRVIHPGFT